MEAATLRRDCLPLGDGTNLATTLPPSQAEDGGFVVAVPHLFDEPAIASWIERVSHAFLRQSRSTIEHDVAVPGQERKKKG